MRGRRLRIVSLSSTLLALAGAGISPESAAASDSRAKVISVELHRSADQDRLTLQLDVKNFRSGQGEFVEAFQGGLADLDLVYAKRVRGSYDQWRIGPRTDGGPRLLNDLARALQRKGVARLNAGVLASGPSGGKLSLFRIKAFNEPAPALGPASH